MKQPCIFLVFHGDTRDLIRLTQKEGLLQYPLNRRASIKDIAEATGLPHTEIGKIVCDTEELTFDFIPKGGEQIHLYPFTREISVQQPTLLRPEPITELRFLADGNVAKLGRNLRMAGINTSSPSCLSINDIARLANDEERIILTRNRELLKIRTVRFGQLLRSLNPLQQMLEVFQRYNLHYHTLPFSRCLLCNTVLKVVVKEQIIDRLEPLTKKYYNDFQECKSCGKIYWRGSHHEKMLKVLHKAGKSTVKK